jgi:hypothetical protein
MAFGWRILDAGLRSEVLLEASIGLEQFLLTL